MPSPLSSSVSRASDFRPGSFVDLAPLVVVGFTGVVREDRVFLEGVSVVASWVAISGLGVDLVV